MIENTVQNNVFTLHLIPLNLTSKSLEVNTLVPQTLNQRDSTVGAYFSIIFVRFGNADQHIRLNVYASLFDVCLVFHANVTIKTKS